MFKFWDGQSSSGADAIFFEKEGVVTVIDATDRLAGLSQQESFAYAIAKIKSEGLIPDGVAVTLSV